MFANSTREVRAGVLRDASEVVQILNKVATGIVRCNVDLTFLSANEAYSRMVGMPPDEIVGRTIADIRGEMAIEVLRPYLERALGGEEVDFEANLPMTLGEVRPVLINYTPWRKADGHVSGFVGSITDISARLRAEAIAAANAAARRASEERLQALQDAALDGFLVLGSESREFRVIDINPAGLAILDRHSEQVVGLTLAKIFPAFEASRQNYHYQRVLTSGQPETREFPWAANGVTKWLRCTAVPFSSGVTVIFKDITENKRVAQAQTESERRLALMFEATSDASWDWDLKTNAFYTSPRTATMLGYDLQELKSRVDKWVRLLHPEDVAPTQLIVKQCLAGDLTSYATELRMRHRDGSWRWMLSRGCVFRDGNCHAVRMVGVQTDITTQKETEVALRESEKRLRLATEAAEVGFWDVDMRTETIIWSPLVEAMFGFIADEPVTLADFFACLHPVDLPNVRRLYLEACDPARRAVYDVEYRAIGKNDGITRWVAAKGRGLFDEAGRCVRVLGTAIDITARKAAEAALARSQAELRQLNETLEARVRTEIAARETAQAQLAQAQRMDALGQLAGGIAHDINNVLQAVTGGAALIDRHADDPETVVRIARMVLAETERGASVTRRLLTFSRCSDLRAEPINSADLLTNLREILTHTLGSGIDVDVHAGGEMPLVLADKGQLETVLVNLATNARDAMDGQGRITLAALPESCTERQPGLPPGRYVCLSVADTGTGMTPEVLARAAEPFFTTKAREAGTGLGLSMARGFAEQSGGALAIESVVGTGTKVTLWLPVALSETAVAAAHQPLTLPNESSTRGHVLLVDDDEIGRRLTAEALEASGYIVAEAADGSSALRWLDGDNDIDVIVSDYSMPGIDGISFLQEGRRRRPDIPSLLLTGFASGITDLMIHGSFSGGFSLLHKPATPSFLAERIETLRKQAAVAH